LNVFNFCNVIFTEVNMEIDIRSVNIKTISGAKLNELK